jgi:hypothetical protein
LPYKIIAVHVLALVLSQKLIANAKIANYLAKSFGFGLVGLFAL